MKKTVLVSITVVVLGMKGFGQEKLVKPLVNRVLQTRIQVVKTGQARTTSGSLPFFDDFSYPGPYPDRANWTDSEVYVNMEEGVLPPTVGVATFDGLDPFGVPYFASGYGYADSLTSQPLDLSALAPADFLYLSFFYQPQGLGFTPDPEDSLLLFFLDENGNWDEEWSVPGTDSLQAFQQVMIPVTDSLFFYSGFQFRFINEATFGDDDNWDIDYVKLNSGRSAADTILNDLAFGAPPTGLLKNYRAMPWWQFAANISHELTTTLDIPVNNGWSTAQTVPVSYSAHELYTGTNLSLGNPVSLNLAPLQQQDTASFPMFPINYSPPDPFDSVDIGLTYWLSTPPTDPKSNDTLVFQQQFGNDFAYDDGIAELGYELIGTGSELAYDFTLNQPDTLRAVEISYVQANDQLTGDLFSLMIWTGINLSGTSAPDTLVGEQDFQEPSFVDSINGFWTYQLDTPLALPAGKFYIGTYQLYDNGVFIGFDENDNSQAHLHYKLLSPGVWYESEFTGALMMRPIFGKAVSVVTALPPLPPQTPNFAIYPNPTTNQLFVRMENYNGIYYEISDLAGRQLQQGQLTSAAIPVGELAGGMYLLTLFDRNQEVVQSVKFVKL